MDLGADIALCQGEQALLDAGSGYATYFWNNGQTSQQISVDQAGTYWVEVSNDFGCTARDTVEFMVNPLPVVDLGEDAAFCEGSSVMISAGAGFSTYEWNNGATTYYINVTEPGEYSVIVTDDNGCAAQDNIFLTMDPLPLAPTVTSGPVSVDNFLQPGSDFACSEGAHATAYEWKLEPSGAGILTATATSAQVTWTQGFTGTAQVSVRSTNECGESAYSPVYEIAVYSSQGIDDKKAITGIRLYPNPNDGNFTLEFNSGRDQLVRFRLTSPVGTTVMDQQETVPAGTYQKGFNLSTLPSGTYQLMISDREGRLISRQQVVVQ